MAGCYMMGRHAFLGSTFFGNDVGSLVVNCGLYSAASAGLDRHKALSLNDKAFTKPVYDSFLKKTTSRVPNSLLMRAWLAGIMLAVFGLWLAVI